MTAAASDAGLHLLHFDTSPHAQQQLDRLAQHTLPSSAYAASILEHTADQLANWCIDPASDFDLPLAPLGTPFQQCVWHQLRAIPASTTISYKQLAIRIGQPNASRAVGAANRANPIAIIIPCHRVIASSGQLLGYAGPPNMKAKLLEHEQATQHALFA